MLVYDFIFILFCHECSLSVFERVGVYECMCVCRYVCMYVCGYACMYICMYVCVCVSACVCNVCYAIWISETLRCGGRSTRHVGGSIFNKSGILQIVSNRDLFPLRTKNSHFSVRSTARKNLKRITDFGSEGEWFISKELSLLLKIIAVPNVRTKLDVCTHKQPN